MANALDGESVDQIEVAPRAPHVKEGIPTLALSDRLALRPREAAATLGLSERTFRSLLPKLPHVREGGVVLVPVEALKRWLHQRTETQGDQSRAERDRIEAIAQDFISSIRR